MPCGLSNAPTITSLDNKVQQDASNPAQVLYKGDEVDTLLYTLTLTDMAAVKHDFKM